MTAIVAIALAAASSPALAQQATKVPRVAYVWLFGQGPSAPNAQSFRARMAELGYVDGKNVQLDYIDAGGSAAKLDAIMEGLVRDKVDVIVAMCTPEALSAREIHHDHTDRHDGHRRSGEGRIGPEPVPSGRPTSPASRP